MYDNDQKQKIFKDKETIKYDQTTNKNNYLVKNNQDNHQKPSKPIRKQSKWPKIEKKGKMIKNKNA